MGPNAVIFRTLQQEVEMRREVHQSVECPHESDSPAEAIGNGFTIRAAGKRLPDFVQ